MALMDKKKRYRGRRYEERRIVRRRTFKRRRRTGLLVFLGLIILTLVALILFGTGLMSSQTDDGSVGQVANPTVDGAPEIPSEEASEDSDSEEGDADDESTDEEDEDAPIAPDDPTMYLDVPKLGISGALVTGGEAGLELGAQLVGGAPWQPGSNTYIAGHRVGWPGTGSDHIFYSLPAMAEGDEITLHDSLGQEYDYQVTNVFAVTPYDVWVLDPTGDDMITLQVCTETPDDWWTIGPSLMSSGPDSGRLMVQAKKV
jgi:sortase A